MHGANNCGYWSHAPHGAAEIIFSFSMMRLPMQKKKAALPRVDSVPVKLSAVVLDWLGQYSKTNGDLSLSVMAEQLTGRKIRYET